MDEVRLRTLQYGLAGKDATYDSCDTAIRPFLRLNSLGRSSSTRLPCARTRPGTGKLTATAEAGRKLPGLPRPDRHEVGQREKHLDRSREARGQRPRHFELLRLPYLHQGLPARRQSIEGKMRDLPR